MEELNGTVEVAAAWVRGGTSKGWIFAAEAVDAAPLALETLLENALGAGDARQIDGVGGATSTTSKIAVVGRSEHAGAAAAPPPWACTRSRRASSRSASRRPRSGSATSTPAPS